jgi:NADPH2:quinone reductase
MKAIQVRTPGGFEALELCELRDPVPNNGEVLVRVHTSGVNFVDVYYREGKYKAPLPFIPGIEGSGHVEALGEGVSDFSIGDPVVWFGPLGSYAEKAVVPVHRLLKIPAGMPLDISAALINQGLTAYLLTHLTFALQPRNTCVVHAAAGGVGSLLTQMAKNAGAKVIATTSTRQKAELARQAGADEVILYTETDFYEQVMKITNSEGVDVVYDREQLTSIVYAVFRLFQDGRIKISVNPPYPLRDVARAHMDLESRKTTGKLVLAIRD